MKLQPDNPAVSVIIPAHNAEEFIVDAISSVLEQTYQNFEIIVVDDASSDNTAVVLEPLLDRVRYIKQEHAGSAVARNRGILAARGQYLAFLDADDLWLKTKLEKQVNHIEGHPGAVLVYTDFNRSADTDSAVTSGLKARQHRVVGQEFQSLLRQNFLHTSSVLVRRESLAEAGIFDPKLINAQDWDLWIRLADIGEFGHIDEILTHYRLHEEQTVKSIKFARNLIYADLVMLARWSNQPAVLPMVLAKTGQDYWLLGRKEWKQGNFKEARVAYWKSARYNQHRLKSIGRALFCSLPSPILRVFQRSNGEDQGASIGN